jgi:outer membrane biosynthesis protein TonB
MMSLESLATEKNHTSLGKGWLVSFIAHLIVIAILFIPMWMSQTPPPEEEGVMVSLGLPDEGQGEEAPSVNEGKPEPEPETKPQEAVQEISSKKPEKQVASKVVTSNEQDAVRVKEAEAKKQAQAESQRRAAEEAKKQEAYNNTKKSYGDLLGGSGKGNTGKPGSQGDPSGDPNAKALEGISKGSGRVGGGLGNRGVLHEPKISDASQKTGRVVISVCVDKNGKVIKADYTQKGSTTTDSELKDIAKRAALQFKFTDSDIEEQCGTITVDFKIKGQ